MTDVLRTETHDGVAVVTLERPEARNALNAALLDAVPEAMAAVDADDSVGAIVVTGADPAFCAGIDLKELQAGGNDFFRHGGVGRPWERTTKPVIGAVNGAAVTGGLEIALHCDFLIASERARFADTHARVGLLPGWGLTVLLPQAVGARKAKEMSLTGNFVDAEEALAFRLVNRVVPHDDLLPTAMALARDMASNGEAARALLASYERVLAVAPEQGLALEAEAARTWNPAKATSTAGLVAVRPDGR